MYEISRTKIQLFYDITRLMTGKNQYLDCIPSLSLVLAAIRVCFSCSFRVYPACLFRMPAGSLIMDFVCTFWPSRPKNS